MDEIDRNTGLSREDKQLQRSEVATQALAAFEVSKTLVLAREAVKYDASSVMRKALEQAEAGWERAMDKISAAVVAEFETKEGRASIQEGLRQHLADAKPADAVQRSLANLREVTAILDAKAPQDAAGFKTWLRAISQNVSEASSEGGFLGIGGVKVSDAEKATLAEISKALGTSA
jgi:hypothetical protein